MFKRILVASAIVLAFFVVPINVAAQDLDPGNEAAPPHAPDQILVRFRRPVTGARADRILAARGLSRVRSIQALDVHVLHLPSGLSVEQAVEMLQQLPEVEFAEPNYLLWAHAPARVEIDDQWGLTKIQASTAWAEFEDKPPVLLGIVDTGIDRYHTDLSSNIWSNPGETPDNGLDDDGNGYTDDTWGWDFRNNDNAPYDDNKHGTLVSSVAAAALDGNGVASVCP